MDEFEDYAINIDTECMFQDFDDIDLYAERYEDEYSSDSFGDELIFE